MCLSLQMSLHMQQISSSFMRVSGVEDQKDGDGPEPIRLSLGVVNKGNLLNFSELSESYEEESDYNPWRESVIEEDSVLSEGKVLSAHMSKRSSVDSICTDLEPCESEEDATSQPKPRYQFPLKWIPADVLFKKVLWLYDSIHSPTRYHVTSGINDVVVLPIGLFDF